MDKQINVTPFYYDYVLAQPYKVIIQVGGRFSSKSYNSEIEMAMNLGSKENYKLLVIEDLDTGLINGYYAGLKDKIEKFEHDKAYSMTKSPVKITNNINGNTAIFSGFASEQQKKSIKAIDQVTAILVEEGEWLIYDDFVKLLHQLRGGKPEDRKLTILMNPVNPHCFVNEMFIETQPDKVIAYFPNSKRPKVFEKNITTTFEYEGEEITDTTTVLIVLSTHHDNPYLTIDQRATIENLKNTDPDMYLQLGEARFTMSSGAYFSEFKREIHVIEPFVIPDHWNRYTTKDYGLDMLAQYWIAIDTYGNAYCYKELYESNLIISDAAKRIKEVNGKDIVKIKYAPPDLENRRQETGKSAFDIFRENGENCTKSDNKRIDGWYAVKEWLKPFETKDEQTGATIITARFKIFSNCVNLIRTLPQLQRDEKEPNDCATEPHEITHAPDAIRGFCIMRQRPTVETESSYKVGGQYSRAELKNKGFNDAEIGRMVRDGKIKLLGK
jgi:phage terminase large subunit